MTSTRCGRRAPRRRLLAQQGRAAATAWWPRRADQDAADGGARQQPSTADVAGRPARRDPDGWRPEQALKEDLARHVTLRGAPCHATGSERPIDHMGAQMSPMDRKVTRLGSTMRSKCWPPKPATDPVSAARRPRSSRRAPTPSMGGLGVGLGVSVASAGRASPSLSPHRGLDVLSSVVKC